MLYCIFEDELAPNFLPLAHFRPVFDLPCGALTIRQKWETVLPPKRVRIHVRQSLRESMGQSGLLTADPPGKNGLLLINGRVLPDESLEHVLTAHFTSSRVFTHEGGIVAAYLDETTSERFLSDGKYDFGLVQGLPAENLPARFLNHTWDLIRYSPDEIPEDFRRLKKELRKIRVQDYAGIHVLNRRDVAVGKKSVIKPGVVLDAENGPIIIGSHVTVMPNAVLQGPVFVGDRSVIKIGAKIYGATSIGAWCKVGGEVEGSVILPYSNKQHEGFLGHSYLGSWVNIGADTNTSDLKNTYGPIKISRQGKMIDTGMQFLGLTMADHSKTGINVMFDTGTTVGVCCNIYGSGLPPKEIPSFSWGTGNKLVPYALEKSLETMRRVMLRRNVILDRTYENLVRLIYRETEPDRTLAGVS